MTPPLFLALLFRHGKEKKEEERLCNEKKALVSVSGFLRLFFTKGS